jgi:predicted alpha/beta superfamily hydrolase
VIFGWTPKKADDGAILKVRPELNLYRTNVLLTRSLRVAYPQGSGRLVLRTELDWNKDIDPTDVSSDGISTFEVETYHPFLYFKPCLVKDGHFHWAKGDNQLLIMTEDDRRIFHPHFFASELGAFSPLISFYSPLLEREHHLRVYLPAGYEENTLAKYPIALMQDGQNLFFPDEAFGGQDWGVDSTHWQLRSMGIIEDIILAGLYSGGAERINEFTKPGYELYGRSLVEEVLPALEKEFRLERSRRYRSVWGSSLGGVVSFYTVWQYPEVFGAAVCMSSPFSHRDDLLERVLKEESRDVAFYLDSGWPGDNYETTVGMAMALISRGWRWGHNLLHLTYPEARHGEPDWGLRLHVPLQMIAGSIPRYSRIAFPVLADPAS